MAKINRFVDTEMGNFNFERLQLPLNKNARWLADILKF